MNGKVNRVYIRVVDDVVIIAVAEKYRKVGGRRRQGRGVVAAERQPRAQSQHSSEGMRASKRVVESDGSALAEAPDHDTLRGEPFVDLRLHDGVYAPRGGVKALSVLRRGEVKTEDVRPPRHRHTAIQRDGTGVGRREHELGIFDAKRRPIGGR